MVRVKPFAAIRPPKNLVTEVAAPPYDVLNSEEAKAMAGEKSLLHITKPEIDFNPIAGEHEQRTYDKAVENFKLWKERGWLVRENKEKYYVYAQTMDGRTQYGIVLCAHTDDYANGIIKKHELTRKEKEDDRMVHVRIQNANIEPVFFAFKDEFRCQHRHQVTVCPAHTGNRFVEIESFLLQTSPLEAVHHVVVGLLRIEVTHTLSLRGEW